MISLLYCGNDRVFSGMLLSLLSVTRSHAGALDVHIATMDRRDDNPLFAPVTATQGAFLQRVLRETCSESQVTVHDMGGLYQRELADSPNAGSAYTPYTLLRLLADKVDEMPDKLLYLDTDTVALSDIDALFSQDVEGCDFAAVRDHLGQFFIGPRYQNAGVLLLNLAHIRHSGLFRQAVALCNRRRYAFPDQDVLNHCERHKRFLPRRFNEQRSRRPDTVIRHFSKTIRWLPFFHTVNVKPWDVEGLHRVYHTREYDVLLREYSGWLGAWERENAQ